MGGTLRNLCPCLVDGAHQVMGLNSRWVTTIVKYFRALCHPTMYELTGRLPVSLCN